MKRKMKSWMLFCRIDISKNCPVVQLVKLTTLKAAQKYQKYQTIKADYGNLARNLSTGIRLIYIFELTNIFYIKKYEFSLDIIIIISPQDLKTKIFFL
jgi:hypothetical protein